MIRIRDIAKILPDEVPVFTEDDMCIGAYKNGDQCCLLGWCGEIADEIKKNMTTINSLYFDRVDIETFFHKKIRKHIWENYSHKIAGENVRKLSDISISGFNDSHSKRTNARVLNAVMRDLGYTEIIKQ